jgi:phospholipase/carboxylesterase
MASIEALTGPVQLPRAGEPTSIVVLLHGYGADGNDLIGLAPFFAQSLPRTAFYSPHAPMPLEGGWGGGRQWFSLRNYDPNVVRSDPKARAALMSAMHEGAQASAAKLDAFLDEVLAHHQLGADRLALIGFSQGTMMSLYVGLRRKDALAGIVGYSGAMIAPDALAGEIKSRPPVLLVHGDADPVVPVQALADAEHALKAANVPYKAHVIPALQHGIDGTGAELGAAFLKDKLA